MALHLIIFLPFQCLEKIRVFVELLVVTDYYLGLLDNTRALQYLFGIEKNVCRTILLGSTFNALSNPLLCTVHSLGSLVMTRRAGKDWFEKMAFQCSLLHSVVFRPTFDKIILFYTPLFGLENWEFLGLQPENLSKVLPCCVPDYSY